eukprot:5167247-Pyramimonas_sp.AAC.1
MASDPGICSVPSPSSQPPPSCPITSMANAPSSSDLSVVAMSIGGGGGNEREANPVVGLGSPARLSGRSSLTSAFAICSKF